MKNMMSRFARSFSVPALCFGTLFFAASLTPSLVPRGLLVQGLLSGVAFAAGYGIAVFLVWLWSYLGLPVRTYGKMAYGAKIAFTVIAAVVATAFLWQASAWQNSVRLLMGLDPVEGARPFMVGAIATIVALILIVLGWLFHSAFAAIAHRLKRYLPYRLSNLAALGLAAALFWFIGNGVLASAAFHGLDASYRQFDALIEDGVDQPADPMKTGSSASLLEWDHLGRTGREAIAARPTRADIEDFTGAPALEPLRVYVGVKSAATIEERAQLALEELKRIGGFDRSVLVITTPTGTGWLDPASQQSLEYLHRGDVTTVAVQYSYLASWLALLAEPEVGAETSKALFATIYGYWRELPADKRPKLYLHGLSLGALNSDLSSNLFQVINDPFDGVFLAGPPFNTPTWREATQSRIPGSPMWLPRMDGGWPIRFTNQTNQLGSDAPEGMRIAFLQYASDPITFFETTSVFRQPVWMEDPRGPDVSKELRWYPVVTFLQLLVDVMTATTSPMGHGHVYAPEHYIDGWMHVTRPQGWTVSELARLKEMLGARLREE